MSGYLVPDLTLDDGRRVASLLHNARPVLLDLCGGAVASTAHPGAERLDIVEGQLSGGPAAVLIRPDGYVAWAADEFEQRDGHNLHTALRRWFNQPE